MQHLTAMKVPDDTVLSHLNMTNRWVIQEPPLPKACDPVEEISRYAVRVSGKHAKDPTKTDLPDGIVDTLIKCLLDGLKMGEPELDRMPEELMSNPTQNNIRRYERMGDALVPRKNTRNRSN
ncbi:hypothetical protein Q1695_000892 [Nippostrongylus brasiliensis]|nr:hypothetical protein Q1695_000892 [Nippostrongylus brasiliensis]